jgi:sterol 3beta-glucosyltransferase
MTKLVIVTIGSRGDAQPYIALGAGLQKAGFQVRIATHAIFADFVEQHGLEFFPLPHDPQEMLNDPDGRAWINVGQNPIRFLKTFARITRPQLPDMLPAIKKACAGMDGVLFAIFGIAAYYVAQEMGIPAIMTVLQPASRTTAFVGMGSFKTPLDNRISNYISHTVVEQVFWQPFRRQYNDWRKQDLGLPPASFWGPYAEFERRGLPVIYGYSGHVMPRPDDWRENICVAGYWFLNGPTDWRPEPGLADFLAAGPPPIAVGFGSMIAPDPAQFTRTVVEAVERTGQRAVFLTGWGSLQPDNLPSFIYPAEFVPHDWLYDQVTAVIHHGGAGTTAAGLRAGRPTIAVPFFADQYFWGDRLKALGVGQSLPRNRLTADKLARAIETAVTDPAMQAQAAQLGQKIRAEDGVGRAVTAVQQIFTKN